MTVKMAEMCSYCAEQACRVPFSWGAIFRFTLILIGVGAFMFFLFVLWLKMIDRLEA